MNGSNGATHALQPTTDGTGPVKRRVKKVVNNPFATARQPGQATRPNGQHISQARSNGVPSSAVQKAAPAPATSIDPRAISGFSDPAVVSGAKPYKDYRVVMSKKDILQGMRYHMMHLNMKDKHVDIRNADQFPRPAHLHRGDPQAKTLEVAKEDKVDLKDGLNQEERDALGAKNELRKQERAANLAQIAPTQATRKSGNQKTKTKAVFHRDFTKEEKRQFQTNYEEKMPWLLEDFDNKQRFVGKNQDSQAHRHVAFAFEPGSDQQQARFRLIPIEKVYEFHAGPDPNSRQKQVMTIDEAEAAYKRRHPMPYLLEKRELDVERKRKKQLVAGSGLFVGENTSNKTAGRGGGDADWDNDDDGGLFADDEEGDIVQMKDEDEALAEKKIKEDQLKANMFDMKEEKDADESEAEEERQEQTRKVDSRIYRKGMAKQENNFDHASGSEYSSSVSDYLTSEGDWRS